MTRLIRNTAILAKTESSYGVDPTPTGAANAILVSSASFDVNYNNINRDLIRGYLGGSEQLAGVRSINCAFDVELSGSGDAGLTAAAWAPLLLACGFAGTDQGAYYEYVPVSASFSSVTIYYYADGAQHVALGCRGTVEFKMGIGERPLMSFKFTGIDGGLTVVSNPALTLTAFKTPVTIIDANAGDVNFGCTYATSALSAGTAYPSRGMTLNLGNTVQHTPLLGGESVDLVQREITGHVDLDLTATQEVAFNTAVNANTLSSLGFSYGTTSGNKIILYMPAVQRIMPKRTDYNGRIMVGMDLRVTPSSGNDELMLVVY